VRRVEDMRRRVEEEVGKGWETTSRGHGYIPPLSTFPNQPRTQTRLSNASCVLRPEKARRTPCACHHQSILKRSSYRAIMSAQNLDVTMGATGLEQLRSVAPAAAADPLPVDLVAQPPLAYSLHRRRVLCCASH